MLTFVAASKLALTQRGLPAGKEDQSKLDKLIVEMGIPYREVNKLAREVVGREFGTVQRLTETENRRLREYMKGNMTKLMERYRGMRWK